MAIVEIMLYRDFLYMYCILDVKITPNVHIRSSEDLDQRQQETGRPIDHGPQS